MRSVITAALVMFGLALLSTPVSSAPSAGDADGWYKWQVEGGMTMGTSCCFRRAGVATERTTCNLDKGHGVVVSDSPCAGDSGTTALYLRKVHGVPTRIRVFDSSCEVSASEAITDMGSLSQDDSVVMLLDIVNTRELSMDVREEALFWLAQSNTDSAFAYFDELLSGN